MWIADACKAFVFSFVAVFHSPGHPDEGPHQDVLKFTHNSAGDKIPYPHFPAPNGPDKDGVEFQCKYPELKGWEKCTSADDRSCWLKGPYDQVFDINTDYENFWPEGVVREGKKYILRVINTSVDTTWIFSIDNHNFTVMSTDFVPIHPYEVDHVVIGIGQRYHIVLDATPTNTSVLPASPDGNYWIRTVGADRCKGFEAGNEPDERQGILRYNASSTLVPTTFRTPYVTACRDENYTMLKPILPWKVKPVELDYEKAQFDIGLKKYKDRPEKGDGFQWWAFGENPLWLNFSNPTILNLNNDTWDPNYAVDLVVPDSKKDEWVYIAITAPPAPLVNKPDRVFAPVAHPLHLHGHDFALLAQGTNFTDLDTGKVKLKWDNPPRRDVALIPAGGYLVVAFKADNPGSWLFHCHIAWHASSGLAIQILEQQERLKWMMNNDRMKEVERVCARWNDWYGNKTNHWNAEVFQDDSGI
ncbi:hypothetical protein ACHAPK_010208 [Fusarium culmorum]